MELREVGGTYGGNKKASPFLCLTLKMLQLAPEKEIAIAFINAEEYKYVPLTACFSVLILSRYMRCLGAFYLRLTGKAADIYQYLELLYTDYRKIRFRTPEGGMFF